jgi:hypothetical protein
VCIGAILAIVPTELCCTLVGDTMTLPITMLVDPDWPPEKPPPIIAPGCPLPDEVLTDPNGYLNEMSVRVEKLSEAAANHSPSSSP